MRPLAIVLLTLLLATSTALAEGVDVDPIRGLVVQHGGRLKPFDTFAREKVREIFDAATFEDQDPVDTALSILADRRAWFEKPFIEFESDELAKEFFDGRKKIAAKDVAARMEDIRKLMPFVEQAENLTKMMRGNVPPDQRERVSYYLRMGKALSPVLKPVMSLSGVSGSVRIVPTNESRVAWQTPSGARARPEAAVLREAWDELLDAYREKDGKGFATAAKDLREAQRGIRPSAVPTERVLDLEVFYNSSRPRTWALVVFVFISLLWLVHAFVRSRTTAIVATLGVVLGIAVNTAIVTTFTILAERLPLKNTHEVWQVVLWFLPVICLFVQGILRAPIYGALGSILSVVGYVGLHFLASSKPDGLVIRPLVAILDSSWREVHILSIMLSYAVLLLAAGIHVAYLVVRLIERERDGNPREMSDRARSLDEQAYHVLAWGFLLLTVGIATGAAWAHSSWGRYWGWDPKEVWATIAWVIYAVFLHLRAFLRWRGGWLPAINLLGFAAILFTYIGVTYLLSGLHSYGSS